MMLTAEDMDAAAVKTAVGIAKIIAPIALIALIFVAFVRPSAIPSMIIGGVLIMLGPLITIFVFWITARIALWLTRL